MVRNLYIVFNSVCYNRLGLLVISILVLCGTTAASVEIGSVPVPTTGVFRLLDLDIALWRIHCAADAHRWRGQTLTASCTACIISIVFPQIFHQSVPVCTLSMHMCSCGTHSWHKCLAEASAWHCNAGTGCMQVGLSVGMCVRGLGQCSAMQARLHASWSVCMHVCVAEASACNVGGAGQLGGVAQQLQQAGRQPLPEGGQALLHHRPPSGHCC